MRKIIFLEGLPGVGKTTILKAINKQDKKNITTINEIIINVTEKTPKDQTIFQINDECKIFNCVNKINVVDRGPISTLSYNQARSQIDKTFDSSKVEIWFQKFIKMLSNKDTEVIFLTRNNKNFYIPFSNKKDPYGSAKNQELLEKITIENCKKYVKNFKIIEYHKENMGEIIDEHIIKYLCS